MKILRFTFHSNSYKKKIFLTDMFLIFLKLLTIFPFLSLQTNMQKKCDNSICNYEAICILNNGNPTCECIQQFYKDEFCSKPTDHCSSNPCQNGGKCESYPGHFNCECSTGFAGQTCASKQDVFKSPHLHYNHIAPIGTEQSLMLTIQNLGTIETLMEFFTEDYIIDGIIFTSTSGHFTKSNDLNTLGKSLHIEHSESLPYKSGFYRISKATFWKLGTHSITLDFSDFGLSGENFFRMKFDILVYDPSGLKCFPQIHLPHCLNPRKPLHLDIQTFDFIEPIVDKRCNSHSSLTIKWSVRNYLNTVVLHKFPKHSGIALTIPPHTMWFNYRDDFVQSYLIQGDVLEIHSNKSHISQTILRCFVFVDSKPTAAFILGGTYREVNINKEITLDGSISRDYARPPNQDQHLQYSWSCTSDDVRNPYCTENIGSESSLSIPPEGLKLDKTYNFSLLVRSSINIYSTHRSSQTIKVVSYDLLFLHFVCLRNCENGKFSQGKLIHLKLECVKCPTGNIDYSVRNEFGVEVSNSQRVVLVEESKEKVYLKAEAKVGQFSGSTSIKLIVNQPPAKGTCSVSPPGGIEYQTLFTISCSGYIDEDNPIDYKFWLGNNILDHGGDEVLTTRLFPTSGNICEIQIHICDDIGACTEVRLEVSLQPITNPFGTWLELLSQDETNLEKLIENGDRSGAFVLIETVIGHMPPDESQEIAKHIVECLRNIKPNRLLLVEQLLTIGNKLLQSVDITSETTIFISELFIKISEGLLNSIKNHEIMELQVETHEKMVNDLAETMARTAIEVEEFPIVHNAEPIPLEDPFLENYSDYGELDIKGVVHISNWLKAFQRLHRCLQIMGAVASFVQLPAEPTLMIKKNGVTSMTVVVDTSEAMSLSWNESKTFIDLSKEFLESLEGDEIAIQALIFESNPLWWNPEQYQINTDILSIGAYTKNLNSLNSKTTKSRFSFYMELKGSSEEVLSHGSIENSMEMVIYERILPENAVLLVTFMPLKHDLRVLLLLEQKLRTYMFKDAKKIQSSQENTTLYIINNSVKKRKGFLAISSNFKVEFSFTLTIKMCTTWNSQSLEWTSEYCSVGNQTNATHIHCSCWHFSMFGAKVYPTFGYIQESKNLVENLYVSYRMLAIICIIILLMFVFLWIAWQRDLNAAKNIVILEDVYGKRKEAHEYLVNIYTNGHTHAGTSSNVTIQFFGSLSESPKYTIYSRPKKSLFHRNAQTNFSIFSSTDLGDLESVALNHDGFGRYPKWNCHMVQIRDEVRKNQYIFMVNRWIYADSEPIIIYLTKAEKLQSRCWIFRNFLANTFSNFYAEQSFSSVRLYGHMNAMEKASIFILKLCITVMGTLLVFGPTTFWTYEMERETYYSMLLDFQKLFLIAFVCHIVGVVAGETVMAYLVWRPNT
ncbi:polycystin family receptor for egg jelly-like [Episyrphus balteatus]|uniref:polycystin family receptor for egg jelly-like n=1 Tax=Episyrphus balteatus TaxID=286459 RepID=UPI002485BCA0|nr:polycystin family receptor for egg jelly-like [Episyrphus balteatus]